MLRRARGAATILPTTQHAWCAHQRRYEAMWLVHATTRQVRAPAVESLTVLGM